MADASPTKQCTHCKLVRPLSEYGPHKLCKGGLNTQCKQCNRDRMRAYKDRLGSEYTQRKHEYDAKRWADGKSPSRAEWKRANKERVDRKRSEWAMANPEKSRAIKQSYKHRRRTAEGDGIGGKDLAAWKSAQPKVCYWCGCRCARNHHVDHYVPLSKGGLHELANLVIACGPCNLKKNAKDPLDFAREVGRLL